MPEGRNVGFSHELAEQKEKEQERRSRSSGPQRPELAAAVRSMPAPAASRSERRLSNPWRSRVASGDCA